MMTVGPWTLPDELEALIASGYWPNAANANRQNLESLVPQDRVRAFAPEEDRIWFDPPPFTLVSDLIAQGDDHAFWRREEAHPDGISPEHSVVIGDFGLGSDAPIILDYRRDEKRPAVLRLKWGRTFADNRWILASESFAGMCATLGISPTKTTKAQQGVGGQPATRRESEIET